MVQENKHKPENKLRRRLLQAMAWFGAAVLYYIIFSLLFDTPTEYKLRHSTDLLKQEYKTLLAEHDSLAMVVENVVARDKNVFATMFDSEPYDFNSEYNDKRVALHQKLFSKSNSEMSSMLNNLTAKLEKQIAAVDKSYAELDEKMQQIGSKRDNIPSIQPVTNHELTLLTAAYGRLMHPFYRTLHNHQGVDYAVPEGTRVFATADGVVTDIKGKTSTSGTTVVIDHGNGYITSYSHLQTAKVEVNQRVHRGDIIALSGNSGLSLAPHLHYEVRYNDMRVDPVHYFFMELTADEYQRIMRISQSGMQSFD